MERNPSSTKRGPGRKHSQGAARPALPATSLGAGPDFRQHTCGEARRVRRQALRVVGRRQYLKALKAERRGWAAADADMAG